MMGRRMMQWNTITKASILVTITLLLILPVAVNSMRLELVHRHHERFSGGGGDVDQVEAVKGFVNRDGLRRQRMNQRWGVSNYDRRRKGLETTTTTEVEMPMRAGRDDALGEYFTEVKVGSPGQRFWLAADTGSEFTWFNCVMRNATTTATTKKTRKNKTKKKHHHHSKRNRTRTTRRTKKKKAKSNPCKGVFCPHRSKSFQAVTCASQKCKIDLSQLFSLSLCPKPSDPCLYDIRFVNFFLFFFFFCYFYYYFRVVVEYIYIMFCLLILDFWCQ